MISVVRLRAILRLDSMPMAAALAVPDRAPQVVPTEVFVADAYRPTVPCDQKHFGLSLASAYPVIV